MTSLTRSASVEIFAGDNTPCCCSCCAARRFSVVESEAAVCVCANPNSILGEAAYWTIERLMWSRERNVKGSRERNVKGRRERNVKGR